MYHWEKSGAIVRANSIDFRSETKVQSHRFFNSLKYIWIIPDDTDPKDPKDPKDLATFQKLGVLLNHSLTLVRKSALPLPSRKQRLPLSLTTLPLCTNDTNRFILKLFYDMRGNLI